MRTFFQDVKHSVRTLAKNPGFMIVVLLTLALGIGVNTAIFSVVYAVLLRPLPFKDPGRLAMLWETWAKPSQNRVVVSPGNFADWREQSQIFEQMAGMAGGRRLVTIQEEPTEIHSVSVTRNFFEVLGVKPLRGRTFSPEEYHPGFRVAIISDSLWRRLGEDPNAVGKSIQIGKTSQLSQEPWTVVGIMPPGFNFPSDDDVWFPLAQDALGLQRDNHFLQVVGRLKPDASLAQAQSEMNTIAARLRQTYPQENGSPGIGVNVVSVQEQTVGEVRRALLVLLAAVGCVLLIACANAANLLLARATTRQREFALRLALGASRWRVTRYMLAESTLLAVVGGGLGATGAYWGVHALVAFDPVNLPRIQEVAVNPSMLLFALLAAIITGMVCGLGPAWRASRADLNEALKEGPERHGDRRPHARVRSALVIAQIALSMVLLTSGGLLLRSFIQRIRVPLGFQPEGVLAVELPWAVHPRVDELLECLRALPGVQSAGAATEFPYDPPGSWGPMEVEDRPAAAGKEVDAGETQVTPGYLRAAGIPLREGRFITASDTVAAPPVAVINEALARRSFAGQDPIGKHIRRGSKIWYTIVGVVGDTKGFGLEGEPMPNIYFSRLQDGWSGSVYALVRTAVPPLSMAGAVRKEIHSWNKSVAITKMSPLEDLLADSVRLPRFYMLLVLAFAALALTLAAVGVYGLLNYSVVHRTHEIGVRMALGADRGDVLDMILRQGLSLILTGVALGLAGGWASARALESMLFQIHATDAAAFAGAALVLIAVALLACFLPAHRATKVDPMVSLRYD